MRHLVVDIGNVLSGPGADDALFLPVVEDIARRTGGRADLYVLSHEHLDHAQGLLSASQRGLDLVADHVWLPGLGGAGLLQDAPSGAHAPAGRAGAAREHPQSAGGVAGTTTRPR